MEYWRQCSLWLINCKVLPANHRVTWESAQVFDLAQTLRDGVLLCHLLNNLRPQSINLKEINLRPQMSQFLCLKNIRTFLAACSELFGMKKSELFEAFDLFDVRDFGKVRLLSVSLQRPFPSEDSVEHDDIYNHLEDLIDENGLEDEEDLYDCVYDDEDGGEIYEDLMKTEAIPPPKQAETDIRSCCLTEIKQTEEKYTETLESIEKHFMMPLTMFLSMAEMEKVFVNIPVSHCLFSAPWLPLSTSCCMCLIRPRLLIYGKYCSHVETAIASLDDICKDREDIRMKLEECSKRANHGKFTLRDLLVVPMQRVLKYHLLLQELVKHTQDATEKSNLRTALDAMKDLAQYVNEVKRDNETLREIDQYQKSIENLNQPLSNYGRPKGDGEVRVASVDKRAKQDRHIFLFDAAVIVCKRRGDNYEMKEVIDLIFFIKYYVMVTHPHCMFVVYVLFRSNIRPENATNNSHEFNMHTFERITSCNSCHMLLRGIFNQGYLCSKCGLGAHKECLGRFGSCGKTGNTLLMQELTVCIPLAGLPKMLVIRNYFGVPSPASGPALSIQTGDIIELICADLHSPWWQGKILTTKEVGFFPSDAVKPCPCVSSLSLFAGPMERLQAEAELVNRVNSTYLVRHRSREYTEYAISIKYNNDVKHIKILTKEDCFYIAENKKFRSIFELIEYYKHHSLREGFRSLDTTLKFPYQEPENAAMHRLNRSGVFTPKVIGVAIARYDFSSRDTRELSLQEGDVVKIYTKSGANGWWRGEVNGRVGWFPSTYVEEGEE
uniref:Vav guanine nucleotide exchange factor 3 n=1 Tax=Sander lucioperca TaxID=283035 RepID=A0A8D0AEE8_SANLU